MSNYCRKKQSTIKSDPRRGSINGGNYETRSFYTAKHTISFCG